MTEQIEQLPDGYYFKTDGTARICPAGFRGPLPAATGTVEYMPWPPTVTIVCRGRLVPATESTTK